MPELGSDVRNRLGELVAAAPAHHWKGRNGHTEPRQAAQRSKLRYNTRMENIFGRWRHMWGK